MSAGCSGNNDKTISGQASTETCVLAASGYKSYEWAAGENCYASNTCTCDKAEFRTDWKGWEFLVESTGCA